MRPEMIVTQGTGDLEESAGEARTLESFLPASHPAKPPPCAEPLECRNTHSSTETSLTAGVGLSQKVPRWGTLGTTLPSRPEAETGRGDGETPLGPLEIVVAKIGR